MNIKFSTITKTSFGLLLISTLVVLLYGCVYHDIENHAPIVYTDSILYEEIVALNGYRYFRNGQKLSPAPPSPHGQFKLRFNDIAWRSLDANGELPVGGNFPEGAVIVKEIFRADTINELAVMKKAPSDGSASNGWIWAEYLPGGEVSFTLNRRGDACINCHGGTPNRDLIRTFDLHQ